MGHRDQTKLTDLPPEIIYSLIRYLPTAQSVSHLALTCRWLHKIISTDQYRTFVQGRFPSIETPPLWLDAARALTSRSRAFDRGAIIERCVLPIRNPIRIGNVKTVRHDRPTLGYRPVIDSYEAWYGNAWSSRKEVLAWGAGADLIIQVKDVGRKHISTAKHPETCPPRFSRIEYGTSQNNVVWAVFNDLNSVNSWDDICSLHLLQSPHSQWAGEEDIIFGRCNGKLSRMAISIETGSCKPKNTYLHDGPLEGTDISVGPDRVLAASQARKSIACFKVDAEEDIVHPFESLKTSADNAPGHRCFRLLDNNNIVVSLHGEHNTISRFTFRPTGVEKVCDTRVDDDKTRRSKATAFEPLSKKGQFDGNLGSLFLSGWDDSTTRLHDLRCPYPVSIFEDTVDDTPIYCIKSIGHERFIVGCGDLGLLKIFDLRMGRHSYLNATSFAANRPSNCPPARTLSRKKDISVFLSPPRGGNLRKYAGPIYGISHPSPTSSTLYVGIEKGVLRLDIASTDDLSGKCKEWYAKNLNLGLDPKGGLDCRPYDLSCYERPLPNNQGKGLKQMLQCDFWTSLQHPYGQGNVKGVRISGWDRRWVQPIVLSDEHVRRRSLSGGYPLSSRRHGSWAPE